MKIYSPLLTLVLWYPVLFTVNRWIEVLDFAKGYFPAASPPSVTIILIVEILVVS